VLGGVGGEHASAMVSLSALLEDVCYG
jgi:hypothetical protein